MQKKKKVQVGLFEKMPARLPPLMILAEVQFELFEKMMRAAMKIVPGNPGHLSIRGQFCRLRRESAREDLQP